MRRPCRRIAPNDYCHGYWLDADDHTLTPDEEIIAVREELEKSDADLKRFKRRQIMKRIATHIDAFALGFAICYITLLLRGCI